VTSPIFEADGPPRRRWSTPAIAIAAVLWVAALALAAWLLTPAPAQVAAAVEIRRASMQVGDALQPVVLPDAWESTAPSRSGTVTYRLPLPDRALQGEQSAVFIRRAGNVFRLSLGGQAVVSYGDARAPQADYSREPVLVLLPQALVAATGNELRIDVSGEAGREPGLSEVWVGPLQELQPLYQAAVAAQVRSAWFVASASAAMGLLALLLGWRTREARYAWFGIASLLWAWRVTALFNSDAGPWLALRHWSFQVSYVGFVVLMSLYALAMVGREGPRVRRWLLSWALAATALTTLGVASGWPWPRTLVLLGMLVLAAWLFARLAQAAVRDRTTPALLLTACAAICVVVGARDFYVFRVQYDYGAYTWARYTIVLLMAALAWMLVNDFARSGARLRDLNRGLRDRIAAKEHELAVAFENSRLREREQATLAERDRILREMHDGLGGRLVAALALAQRAGPLEPAEALRELKLALDDCLTELRLALDSLETDTQPVVEALAELRFRVEPSLRAAGIRVVWQVDEAASDIILSAADTLHVLRIVREAFTNVIKHASANTVWLRLEHVAEAAGMRLRLSVVDNGAAQPAEGGAPREPLAAPSGGRGLANIRRRAQSLKAELEIGPQEEGWGVSVRIPLGEAGTA
jgi:signal transduction histidine kinase